MTTDSTQVEDSTSWLALIDVAAESPRISDHEHSQQEDSSLLAVSSNIPQTTAHPHDPTAHEQQTAHEQDDKGKPCSVKNHDNEPHQYRHPLTTSSSFSAESDEQAMELTLHPSQNDLNLENDIHSEEEDEQPGNSETALPMSGYAIAVKQDTSPEILHRRHNNTASRRQRRRQRQRHTGFPPSSHYVINPGIHVIKPSKGPHVPVSSHQLDQASCLSFMFLAVQSDPYIMYRDNELGFDERVTRSINSTCGMTVIALNHSDPLNLHSDGLCMRTKWARMDKRMYSTLRPRLIFRDKFCNYRNFREMKPHVKWSNTTLKGGSIYRPFGRQHSYDNQVTTFPTAVVNSMSSTYQFLPIAEFEHPDMVTTLTKPHRLRLQRFAGFYREILRFIIARTQGEQRIILYHRLPQNMLWLAEDMRIYAASTHNGFIIDFIKMQGNAKNPHISAHCLHRSNHNTVICEICLFEAYLPQLLDEINTT